MLNSVKDSDSSHGEEMSMYSLVSEANNDDTSKTKSEPEKVPTNSSKKIGLLILDGEEEEDVEHNNGGAEEEMEDESSERELSVPETVFLPSEVMNLTGVSVVTHEQHDEKAKTTTTPTIHDVDYNAIILRKVSMLVSAGSRWVLDFCALVRGSIFTMQMQFSAVHFPSTSMHFSPNMRWPIMGWLLPALAVLLLSVASWRSYVWKQEALRLQEQLQQQNLLLPLTASLLIDRHALLKKRQLLEEAMWRTTKKKDCDEYENAFPHYDGEDGDFLSFKNCYVEASLSLGRCSKEWQRWWSEPTKEEGEECAEEQGATPANEYASYEDGFTDEMSKLMETVKSGLVSTTKQSYLFLKDLSYDGVREAFYRDD